MLGEDCVDQAADAEARVRQGDGLLGDVGDAEHRRAGQAMGGGEGIVEPLMNPFDDADVGMLAGVEGDADVGVVGQHRVDHIMGAADVYGDRNAGMARLEVGDRPGQEIADRAFDAAQCHLADPVVLHVVELGAHALEAQEGIVAEAGDHLAGIGERDAARLAREELRAELLLELEDLAADRGRRDVQELGGGANGARADDGAEVPQGAMGYVGEGVGHGVSPGRSVATGG